MKKIVSILIFVLLAILLVINAFTYSIKTDVLKSSVVNRIVDNSSIYDSVYNAFEQEGKRKAALVMQDNGLDPELGDWMWNNISEVFPQEYIEYLTRTNIDAIVKYILGESEELATFNLLPKYAQLMDVTAKNLDSEVISQIVGIENEGAKVALNLLDNLTIDDGIKKQVVESIFESTDKIKAPFMVSTTEQLLGLVGQEQQLESIYDARYEVEKYKRNVSSLLLVIVVLCIAIIVGSFNRLRKGLNNLWITFAISGIVVLIAGLAIGFFEINVIEFIYENISNIGLDIKSESISSVLYLVAYSSMKVGLVYILIAAVFLLIPMIFKGKLQKKLDL